MLLLLLLLSRFSCVQLCATPETAAHRAPLSLGFSRQEHWSGLPFPPPIHESENWKLSHSVVSDSLATPWTAAYQAPPSMGFSRQEYWSEVPLPSLAIRAIVKQTSTFTLLQVQKLHQVYWLELWYMYVVSKMANSKGHQGRMPGLETNCDSWPPS